MKIAVLGAGGVRTPLIVKAMSAHQARTGLSELALMDIDAERLEIIGALTAPLEQGGQLPFRIVRTTDAAAALSGADFVITTFRVGGIASRVIDEQVPLSQGVLGQETTGPGGFAMAMRSIPVLLAYIEQMRRLCPDAWLVNFANPAGLMAEAAVRAGGWQRTVGICDSPGSIGRLAAALLRVPVGEVFVDYFGLNHLGWVRSVIHGQEDHLPRFIQMIVEAGGMPGLPFAPGFIASLGMIPNEYLFYYYHATEAVHNILHAERSRGEQIAALNEQLFADLARLRAAGDLEGMASRYHGYLKERGGSYMASETGGESHLAGFDAKLLAAIAGEGYAGVALDLIETLEGVHPRQMILNVPNQGAIDGMGWHDVVEVPAFVSADFIRPLAVGPVPAGPLGLMKQVKAYEQLTIAAATEGSYAKALQALTIHPLVRDHRVARAILKGYRERHGSLFPALS